MEIPDNGGLIQKFYVVGRCNAAKTLHSFSVHIPFCFLQRIIILIIQKAGNKGKSPVREYHGNPFIAFSIFLLKAHKHCLGLILYCHNHRKHFPAICIPHRFPTFFYKRDLVKRKEVGEVIFRRKRFLFDEMILWKIHRIIGDKFRCGRKCGHQSKKSKVFCKALNPLF